MDEWDLQPLGPHSLQRDPRRQELPDHLHRPGPVPDSSGAGAIEKTFTEVPIELLVPPNYSYVATLLRERTTDVQVTGPKSIVDALKKENIVLYVDVRDPKLVPQDTPYTQPVHAQIVDEHQRRIANGRQAGGFHLSP